MSQRVEIVSNLRVRKNLPEGSTHGLPTLTFVRTFRSFTRNAKVLKEIEETDNSALPHLLQVQQIKEHLVFLWEQAVPFEVCITGFHIANRKHFIKVRRERKEAGGRIEGHPKRDDPQKVMVCRFRHLL